MRSLLETVIEIAIGNLWKSLSVKSFSILTKPSKPSPKSLKKNGKKSLDVRVGLLRLNYSLKVKN